MGASAAILFPFFGEAAAAAPEIAAGAEAAAGVGAADLAGLYAAAAAPLPSVFGDIAAGTFEFAPAAEAAAAAAPLAAEAAEAAGAAAPAADLSYLPIQFSAAGAPVAATDAAAGAGALGSSGTAVGNALAGTSPVTTGIGSVASSVAPTTEAAASTLPVTESTDLSYLPIQQSAAGTPIPATSPLAGAGSLGSSGTAVGDALAGNAPLSPLTPTLNDATSSAEQTFGGTQGQIASNLKDTTRLGSPAITNTAVDQAPVTAPAAPATPATPAAAPVAPAAAAPAATEAITPTTDALSGAGGTSNLVKGATDAGGDGLLGGVKSFMKDYGSLALGGAGLAYNMLKGNEPVPYSAQLESQAAQLQAQGAQLQGYLTSGTLPPGMDAALQSAHNAAAAAIRSRYANMGMSGSSAEMNDLSNLAYTTVSQGANIASQLMQTGVNEQQFASGLYQNLMAQSVAQDTAMSNAMAGFTNAMAGGYARAQTPTAQTPTNVGG